MMDPDAIIVQEKFLDNTININNVPEYEIEIYALDDDKEFERYIKDIEFVVRRSFEYREFVKYLKDNMNMNKCSFIKGVSNEESSAIKIEIHHYPFSLSDICRIVYRKRKYYNESLEVQMIAKEVMQLHFKLMVGVIPLSKTVHQLFHNGRLFIPVDKVLGRYNLFIDYYKPFIEPSQLEVLERIEKYTQEEQNYILDTTIIEQNKVSYNITNNEYMLPDMSDISDNMVEQIETIKDNNYILPNIKEIKMIEDHNKREAAECPIYFTNK